MALERVPSERAHAAYNRFQPLLDAQDKEGCVLLALSLLQTEELDIVTLYEGIIGPLARNQACVDSERSLCVWKEHVRTSILRTVVECCYPHLMQARRALSGDMTRGLAVIGCPTEEYHELGARIVADFFTLCGFNVTFVGANTPQKDILEAVPLLSPEFAGVSVTGPYNLIAARRTIQQLVALRESSGGRFRIVVGGQAFGEDLELAKSVGADVLVQNYDGIFRLCEEVPWFSR